MAVRFSRMRYFRYAVVGTLFLTAGWSAMAQSFAVSGYVEDAESGERIPGANLHLVRERAGTSSNQFGFFSLSVGPRPFKLSVTHVAYFPQVVEWSVQADTSLVFLLQPRVMTLDAIVVTGEGESRARQIQMSQHSLPVEQVESLPVLLGETDVLKTLQLLPGIQSGREGFSGIYVRGGRADQNLILLDGLPLYNPNHVLGLFSVFNPSAMKQVELIKGGFPARYGGRLSSVVSLTMKEGNLKHFGGEGKLGLITSRLMFEGPIVRERASFIVSGRRTFLDQILRWFQPKGRRYAVHFQDLNFKANYIISGRDRIYLSGYMGKDAFAFRQRKTASNPTRTEMDMELGWQNQLASIRWNHLFGERLFANVTAGVIGYRIASEFATRYSGPAEQPETYRLIWRSSVLDYMARLDMEYAAGLRHYMRFGMEFAARNFTPSAVRTRYSGHGDADLNVRQHQAGGIASQELALYVEDDVQLPFGARANLGLRLSGAGSQGRVARALEPRASVNIPLSADLAAKVSYAFMQQYMHLMAGTGSELSREVWIPFMRAISPQRSSQVAVGLVRSFLGYGVDVSLESYYKRMNGQLEYKANARPYQASTLGWPSLVERGRGTSYGAELFVERQRRRLSGWLSYTWARTTRRFTRLNAGVPFPDGYDRRHDVSVVGQYRLTDHTMLAASWVYGSGYPIWLPSGRYQDRLRPTENDFLDYGPINSARVPAAHHLDVSAHFTRQIDWGERTFILGLYNAYNRRNPLYVYPEVDASGVIRWKQLSLLQLIPAVSYQLRF